jgi:AraC-like DNA-binding protein
MATPAPRPMHVGQDPLRASCPPQPTCTRWQRCRNAGTNRAAPVIFYIMGSSVTQVGMESLAVATKEFIGRADGFLFSVLDALPEVYVFAKDTARRFVYCNSAFVSLMGFKQAVELIGLSDADLSPAYLVEHYRQDDTAVLAGTTLTDRVELVRSFDGSYDWFTTTKQPVRERGSAKIIGLVGITRPLTKREALTAQVQPLEGAVRLMSDRYGERLSTRDIAACSAMSPRAFSEKFRQHFGMTPNRYLRKIRLLAASELLATTELSIGVIANRVGYYDQSHLDHDFRRFFGMSPREYRTKYQQTSPGPKAVPGHAPLGYLGLAPGSKG